MTNAPSMQLMRLGKPRVKRFERDYCGRTKRVHAYVTFGSKCNSACGFCRNKVFDKDTMDDDFAAVYKSVKKYYPYIHSVTFGGGEPLLYASEIYKTVSDLYDSNINAYIVTNGTRKLFLDAFESCGFCRHLSGILISRHHYDDKKNAEIFHNNHLLSSRDIDDEICSRLKSKIEFAITCFKGGIDSPKKIINYIKWGISIGIHKFLFNDLQKDVTDEEYWDKNQIKSNVFDDVIPTLLDNDFKEGASVCYTAGYDIITFTDGLIRVGFKRYHQSKNETIEKWNNSNKFTYDLSIMPNGSVFSDWSNANKIT